MGRSHPLSKTQVESNSGHTEDEEDSLCTAKVDKVERILCRVALTPDLLVCRIFGTQPLSLLFINCQDYKTRQYALFSWKSTNFYHFQVESFNRRNLQEVRDSKDK